MRTRIFVPLLTYPDASSEAVVQSAVRFAGMLGEEVRVVALEADIPPVTSALSRVLTNMEEVIRDAERLSAKAGSRLLALARGEAETAGKDVTARAIKAAPPVLGEAAAAEARYFDISVVPWSPAVPCVRILAEAMVFGSGRPSILTPENAEGLATGRVAIAWDGSRVAARAVADAARILDRAEEVHVITVTDEKPLPDDEVGGRLAEGLRQRGLNARFSPIQAEDCPIAETLQRHAVELGAGLLVMGGCGHSRLRDFVLGGATAGVIADLKLPVLLSH